MAVTRLLRIKETPGNNPAAHLKKNLYYICRPDKTADGLYIGGNAGVSPEIIYDTMKQNKRLWGKESNLAGNCTQGFHYMLSFPPDCGISEETAYQIAQEFCAALLGERYFYAFAVHNDRSHIHTHITFDSVSKEDGAMFHSPKKDWERRIQPITDQLCQKYSLPTLQYDPAGDRKGMQYADWQAGKRPEKPSYRWYDIIRDDIDQAIHETDSYEAFLAWFRREHYAVRDGKYLSLRPEGRERLVRTGRLGKGYGKQEICQRIQEKGLIQVEYRYRTYGDRAAIKAVFYQKVQRAPHFKMTPFQKEFYRRWNNTYGIRKPGRKQAWKYRKDILEVEKLSDALAYLIDQEIGTPEALQDRLEALEQEQQATRRQKDLLWKKYRRNPEDNGLKKLQEIEKCKVTLRDIRQEHRLARETYQLFTESQERQKQPIQKQTEQIENDPQHQKSCSDREEGHIWKTDR